MNSTQQTIWKRFLDKIEVLDDYFRYCPNFRERTLTRLVSVPVSASYDHKHEIWGGKNRIWRKKFSSMLGFLKS